MRLFEMRPRDINTYQDMAKIKELCDKHVIPYPEILTDYFAKEIGKKQMGLIEYTHKCEFDDCDKLATELIYDSNKESILAVCYTCRAYIQTRSRQSRSESDYKCHNCDCWNPII